MSTYTALLFDLDGVITRTAGIHADAWGRLFGEVLSGLAPEAGGDRRPFDPEADYRNYVDGRRRYDGVRAFLASRGIHLPEGTADDDPTAVTVCGLGNRKNRYFQEALRARGVETYDDARALIRGSHGRQRLAVVSASENCAAILVAAGLWDRFDVVVTGVDAQRQRLAGKPAPDTYLEAARRLQAPPARSVVLEDAIAGVQAGVAGGFGLVVGVDRRGDPAALHAAGADVVVSDLRDLLPADRP